MKDSRQRILDKLAKTNKRLTSVKHKVDLSNITELDDHMDMVHGIVDENMEQAIYHIEGLQQALGFLAGAVDLAKEDLGITLDMENAIADLGIETPQSLKDVMFRATAISEIGNAPEMWNDRIEDIKNDINSTSY